MKGLGYNGFIGPEINAKIVTVLVGDGPSIAFNPEHQLAAITQEIVKRISSSTDGGSVVVDTMKRLAEHGTGQESTTNDDFERLVGAFGSESRNLT